MARIKIKDLPKDKKISKEEMRKVTGGTLPIPLPSIFNTTYLESAFPTTSFFLGANLPGPLPRLR